jgi:GntR family transcriptional regulator
MRPNAQIRIDLDSATPVNRQIVDHLRTLLVNGGLAPGDVLPSVRRLAIDLGVHFNTVADAYRTLADEGWLEVRHGRDVRVMQRKAPAADAETLSVFQRRLRQLVAEVRAQGLSSKMIARELSSLAKGNEL